ncbi:amino acid permease [Kocuria sp. JC486]|uniref:amino acid permease n=1 Tax=Kocuria sp. JC486 TaxID=1970736 RepID=UPI0032AF2CD2
MADAPDPTARVRTPEPSGTQLPRTAQDAQLKAHMKGRHLVMMSLGSAIGAGLFVGSGVGIQAAGPAVLISYAIAGVMIVLIMRMLGEMVADRPTSGAFSVYAGRAMGPATGFAVGWLWWVQLIIVIAAEATAAAQILSATWPIAPQWVLALIFMCVFTAINLTGVGRFGEFEFWFSLLKVVAVLAFLVIGVLFIADLLPTASPGTTNLTEHGGFMPQGIGGVAAGLLIVAFAFGGIEIVAVAAAETEDPQRNVGRAIRTIMWRILVFYMGSVLIMVLAMPWNSEDLGASPFVAVLQTAGLPAVATTMAVVVTVALLSSLNANLYGASRMIYSLSHRELAPAGLQSTNKHGVPVAAVLASVAFGFVTVALNYVWAEEILGILINIVGSTLIFIWTTTILSHLILRRRAERKGRELTLKAWGYPWLSVLTLIAMAAVIVLGMTMPEVRQQILLTGALFAALWVIGAILARRRGVVRFRSPEEVDAGATGRTRANPVVQPGTEDSDATRPTRSTGD